MDIQSTVWLGFGTRKTLGKPAITDFIGHFGTVETSSERNINILSNDTANMLAKCTFFPHPAVTDKQYH